MSITFQVAEGIDKAVVIPLVFTNMNASNDAAQSVEIGSRNENVRTTVRRR